MAFEILVEENGKKEMKKKLEDHNLTMAYVFHLLTEERTPYENILINNTATKELQDLDEWLGN